MIFNHDSLVRTHLEHARNLLEQTRLVRKCRLWSQQRNSAAIKIQKCFRGRKAVEAERLRVRDHFFLTYGKPCQNVDRHSFGLDSDFLRQLLFFFNPQDVADFSALVETCRLLQQFVQESAGDILSLFAGVDYSSKYAVVDYRVKRLAYACIRAVHQDRNQLKDQLFMTSDKSSTLTILLLEAVVMLIDPGLPWSCKIVGYLLQRNTYSLLREIVLTGKESIKLQDSVGKISSLESILSLMIPHVGQRSCVCANIDPRWSFASQIFTIPFLWKLFPDLREIFVARGLSVHYVHQMTLCVQNHANVLPNDIATEFPGYACLLGNLLEMAGVAFSQPDCSFDMAIDFAAVATFLLDALPPMQLSDEESDGLNKDLKLQISNAIDPRFLLQLTNVLFGRISFVSGSYEEGVHGNEVVAVGAACAFLHMTFDILPHERIITALASRTELVPVLWKFMKRCHENQMWSALSGQVSYLPGDAPGWLLPLSVFCPVYKHMVMIVDYLEFCKQEEPLSIEDIKCLIVILREALWQLLWVNPVTPPDLAECAADVPPLERRSLKSIQHRVGVEASDLLSQLQDWNRRLQFTPPSDFHVDGVNDHFISQAMIENSRAHAVLRHAPFLVPFTSRVKIFTLQLAAARQRHGPHAVFTSNRFRIRRDHILEDAFSQLSALSKEDLRGLIRVTFVNGFGVEEAGIDGGGIFKDFMENITQAAFDVQYGLFKETVDHLLYPNPGSGMIHEQHLQFFCFLGAVLAKAMFEGILVDIPFAIFFLSKLRQKFYNLNEYNHLNDLPSLDQELYHHLIFLKHYEGDISDLELYFVIVNNEYGEQKEEELLPGGKSMRVTNENVITFIHLTVDYRLNYQICLQSSHFLLGFQQLIRKDWIDVFNEHELQLLISGPLDGFDVEDLRAHTKYEGGYHSAHYVIDMLWAVLKNFSMENQMKFLKFVTGCSRGPLLGFKYLEPLFCIQRAAGNASEEALDQLPTSATCMNLLKLPPYRSEEQMERKLLYAINADAGFDLS